MSLLSAVALKDHYASGAWRDETIYDIVGRHAANRPDDIAIRSTWRTFTWQELVDDGACGDFEKRLRKADHRHAGKS